MRKVIKIPLVAVLISAFLFLMVMTLLIKSISRNETTIGWGDNGGGRQSYTYEEINKLQLEGKWDNKIVFNSISNSPIGDEKNFVGAREYNGPNTTGAINVWNANEIDAKNGQEYIIRAYVHNNNPNGYAGLAENVKVAFNIPTVIAKEIPVHGYIFSDNASPSEYWDGVLFKSDIPFHLEYIYGSALLENSGIGSGGIQLSDAIPIDDEIVTKAASNNGTLIGYDALDGKLPGCFQYSCYVTIRVRVVFDATYTVEQRVRLVGETEWKTSIDAKIGDVVEYSLQYKNTSEDEYHENVIIKDIMPNNMRYIPGSTVLYNSNHPDGLSIDQDSLITVGINVGHYYPGANAVVTFTAEIVDKDLQNGSNTLVNWVQSGVNGYSLKQDYSSIIIFKD